MTPPAAIHIQPDTHHPYNIYVYMTIATTPHISRCLRLLLLAAALAAVCAVRAQNNSYGIRDELYAIYIDAYRLRTDSEGLRLSEKMYRRARETGDRVAQCLAYTIPVAYYYHNRQEPQRFFKAVKQLQDMALANRCEQFYYYGVNNKVNFLIMAGRYNEAADYAHEVEDFARRSRHQFGIYMCLCDIGQIYLASREVYTALAYFGQAEKMAETMRGTVDMANIYRKFGQCYAEVYEYGRMMEYGLKAYNAARSDISRIRALPLVCIAAFMDGQYDVFKSYYDAYAGLKKTVSPESADPEERNMAILKLLYDRHFDRAREYIMRKQLFIPRERMLVELYRLSGDYRSMAYANDGLYRYQIASADSVHSSNYDGAYARFFNMQLDMAHQQLGSERQRLDDERRAAELDHASLQLANTQLSLRNSSLELSRMRSSSDLLRLSYNRKKLEAAKLRGDIDASKAQQEISNLLSLLGAVIVMLLLAAMGGYLWIRSKVMIDLKDTNATLERNNRELTAAKNRAEAANNVKAAFFHNMSADIQAPLNAITTLAQQISGGGKTMTQEQKRTLSRQINDNTATLLGMVDRMLKNS